MKKKHKVLFIVRHAKSSWDYDNIADIDRPLKLKGIKTAYEIARNLKLKNDLPELIITSPANRAIHTALIFARVFEIPGSLIRIDEGFYDEFVDYYLHQIKKTDESVNSLMVFGHNPGFTELANSLLPQVLNDLPTAGTVKIEFTVDSWEKIDRETVKEYSFIFPERNNNNHK
jgi:phosphohistidine phosphatase